MPFAPIPQPSMIPDQQAGGGLVTALGGMNALTKSNLGNQLAGSQAQFYPMHQALQAYTNPMLWMALKDNPAAQNAIVQSMQNTLQSMGTNSGSNSTGNGIGRPSLMGKLFDSIGNVFSGSSSGDQSQGGNGNSLNSPPSYGAPQQSNGAPGVTSPLLPSQGGTAAGISGNMTAPLVTSQYPAGSLSNTGPSGATSAPTGGTIDAAQTAIAAVERTKPMLSEVIKDAPRFLSTGKLGKLVATGALNEAEQYFGSLGGIPDWAIKQMGMTKQDLSDYNNWKTNIANASESVMKALNLPANADSLHMVQGVLMPQAGEDGKGYASRVQTQLEQLINQETQNKGNLNQGFQVGNSASPANYDQGQQTNGQVQPKQSMSTTPGLWQVHSKDGTVIGTVETQAKADRITRELSSQGYYISPPPKE